MSQTQTHLITFHDPLISLLVLGRTQNVRVSSSVFQGLTCSTFGFSGETQDTAGLKFGIGNSSTDVRRTNFIKLSSEVGIFWGSKFGFIKK